MVFMITPTVALVASDFIHIAIWQVLADGDDPNITPALPLPLPLTAMPGSR